MAWLSRKSHRSSAPSNEQGRNGAHPSHSGGAVVPHAGPAVAGEDPAGPSGETPPGVPPDRGSPAAPDPGPAAQDANARAGDTQESAAPDTPAAPDAPATRGAPAAPDAPAAQDTAADVPAARDMAADAARAHGDAGGDAGQPGPGEPGPARPEHESAMRAAAGNPAFRAAARTVWPGTEDRLAEPVTAPDADPAPANPGMSSFGPLGAALRPGATRPGETGQAGAPSGPYGTYPPDRSIWEPRRLYKEPLLRPRRGPGPAPDQPHTGQQSPPPGEPRRAETVVPSRPEPGQPGTGLAAAESSAIRNSMTAVHTPSGEQLAITAGRAEPGPGGQDPAIPGGPISPGSATPGGTERTADRLRLADLMADSRMRIWKRRVLVAVAAGLVFTFIFTWRAGLTAAVLAAIADVVYRSRTAASIPPGVRLTRAQKRTQRQLARMERSGYRALNSRPIPGSREQIDHFVVGPTGAYAIDSEAWDKRLPIRTKNARQLWHGPFSKKDRLEHALWEAQQAAGRLTAEIGVPVQVRPVLAVYGPRVPWHVATIREVDVFDGGRLRKYLRRNAVMKDRPRLTGGEVEQIYAAAARVLPLSEGSRRTPVG